MKNYNLYYISVVLNIILIATIVLNSPEKASPTDEISFNFNYIFISVLFLTSLLLGIIYIFKNIDGNADTIFLKIELVVLQIISYCTFDILFFQVSELTIIICSLLLFLLSLTSAESTFEVASQKILSFFFLPVSLDNENYLSNVIHVIFKGFLVILTMLIIESFFISIFPYFESSSSITYILKYPIIDFFYVLNIIFFIVIQRIGDKNKYWTFFGNITLFIAMYFLYMTIL